MGTNVLEVKLDLKAAFLSEKKNIFASLLSSFYGMVMFTSITIVSLIAE